MLKKLIATAVTVATLALPMAALAQVNVNTIPGTTFGLGTADLQSTVVKIIQWVLGFLGLIAVIMILYGGFMWMTAGGNEDKVASGKKIIIAAVIGLIVVLIAWAIVIFVVSQSINVTE
jgi:hypothetical protein